MSDDTATSKNPFVGIPSLTQDLDQIKEEKSDQLLNGQSIGADVVTSKRRKRGRPPKSANQVINVSSEESQMEVPTSLEEKSSEATELSVALARSRRIPKRKSSIVEVKESEVVESPPSSKRGKCRQALKLNSVNEDSSSSIESPLKPVQMCDGPSPVPEMANIKNSFDEDMRDPLEEDFSESSCDNTLDRWHTNEANSASFSTQPSIQPNSSTCPSPTPSSSSSTVSSCADLAAPASSGKRTTTRIRRPPQTFTIGAIEKATVVDKTSSTPNGISPRKVHKKFGLFSHPPPPPPSSNDQDKETSSPMEVTTSSPAMKVKSRWRLSVDNESDSELKTKSEEPSTPEVFDVAEVAEEIRKRLASFQHITENEFRCERRYNKDSRGMDCDCTLGKEDVSRGRKGCGDDCLNRLLFIECGKNCSLGKRCSNKRFQNVENAPTEVFKTVYKGFGVRATQDIPKDTFLMEYVGEVLDLRQFRKRARKYASDDVQHFYFMALSADYFIDASSKGSISRFINHSCDPNAETQKWTVDGELRVGFFSKRLIRKGEEITFDYKYERYGQEAQKCFCGAKNCRGWLGGEPDKENKKPTEAESDEDYWSSTSSEEGGADVAPSKQVDSSSVIRVKPKKIRQKKLIRSPRKIKNFEAQEFDEEIERLKSTGIRTKGHTVSLCRLIVRASDLKTKQTLIELLRTADTPCRRLFLDYHGLKLLNSWMSRLSDSDLDHLELKIALEDLLSALNIPHKTMLVDTKVWQTISRWADPSKEVSAETSRSASPIDQSGTTTPLLPSSDMLSPNQAPDSMTERNLITESDNLESNDLQPEEVTNVEVDAEEKSNIKQEETFSQDFSLKSEEVVPKTEDNILVTDSDKSEREIVNVIASQKVQSQEMGYETTTESQPPEVTPIAKPQVSSTDNKDDESAKMSSELEEKLCIVRAKAVALLQQWANLQEVFKIPKRELLAMRAAHEREVDRAAAAATHEQRPESNLRTTSKTSFANQSGYDRSNYRFQRPESPRNKLERRISRFDDQTGMVNAPNLSREHRRQIFALKAKQEEEEKHQRLLLQQQHENKCYYLRLNPAITAMFPQYPEFYFDPASSQWHQMPEAYPKVDVKWGFPAMANLPYNAFKEGDEPLPDPAYIYPPGVVPVSYCFGHPMSLDPNLLPVAPPLPPQPPPEDPSEIPLPEVLPVTYIDPDTGEEVPIPELQPGYTIEGYSPSSGDAVTVSTIKKLTRPDVAPHLRQVGSSALTNGSDKDPSTWLARQPQQHINHNLHYLTTTEDSPPPLPLSEQDRMVVAAGFVPIAQAVSGTTTVVTTAESNGKKAEVEIRLPMYWRVAQDQDGQIYYYQKITRETRWDPPPPDNNSNENSLGDDLTVVEMDTASTDSEGEEIEEDGDESDDGGGGGGDKEEENGNKILMNVQNPENRILTTSGDAVYSDLSAHEKELLLKASRKKSKEERQNERRAKREKDREKREYERKRRRERHGKHRRDGLVQEYLIPRRSDREKTDIMKELKDRLANRAAIREEQELEEQAELEREKEIERSKREQMVSAAAAALRASAEFGGNMRSSDSSSRPTTAAADTSSEVVRKIKDRFRKEASKVVVKYLDPYRRPDAVAGRIQSIEDFKHLAKKLTNYLLTKEQHRCKRIEDLKFSESVKKKAADFVRKYMMKFGQVYKRSPNNDSF